ncbi:2-aminoethylphosphonate aminotransferase [Paenibacillus lutimineralis]|uniref:2-aminoethylphosphonate--pyruvate transaminase n=1 Tax=Paenibacillus lutimineralis TaxID=2707005 RepID=A0A3S9UZ84_9BACL|nr:2-aminoethylphosphonate--pyruvate transaminase [Paenibacillus lutimineralis]AZS15407.1 2-aminoethylphosphonate--pyruvate transaminase [Paenibacillus lutimineralis]
MSSTVKRNILLTPGPATTTESVKWSQVVPDICPREAEFGEIMEHISTELTCLVADPGGYQTVLFGGSGTAAVESMISSVPGNETMVIINNGAYGKRMCEIAAVFGIDYLEFKSPFDDAIHLADLERYIQSSGRKITHLAVVHHETTTGLLNKIKEIGLLCKKNHIDMIVDAMSSFAAIPIDMKEMNISFLASSSNKNLQGMPGVSFVIAEKSKLESLKDRKPRSYYLNLYAQYRYFAEHLQMRFTPPVQILYALRQAIEELKQESVAKRHERYVASWNTLISGLKRLGLTYIVPEEHHSKMITSIREPYVDFDFQSMHDFFYSKGVMIYPGKLEELKTFRIANIGDITSEDIEFFLELFEDYLGGISNMRKAENHENKNKK